MTTIHPTHWRMLRSGQNLSWVQLIGIMENYKISLHTKFEVIWSDSCRVIQVAPQKSSELAKKEAHPIQTKNIVLNRKSYRKKENKKDKGG